MDGYIGRQAERREFTELLKKRTASLVTCQGRRRVGKSRFIEECAAAANHFLSFIGLPPREGITKQEQLDSFSGHLTKQTAAPRVVLPDWPTAFQLLASQLPTKGSVVVLLDEISWMAIGDQDFAGHLKTAWDQLFSKIPGLTLVLCGSVSSWIEENILNSTGFVGRCSWQFHLKPLPLAECVAFWGKRASRVAAADKWRVLAVTGGVPSYLEQIVPTRSAEENIERLCFHQGGMLFHEFERIFHDIFTRRAATCRDIVSTLVSGPKSLQQISEALERERGGSLGDALTDLELAGFLRKDRFFDPATGKTRPRDHRYRIADNYLRFYLKYIEPAKERILKGLYQRQPIETLEAWDAIMGHQFETLVLDSLDEVFERLGLKNRAVLNAGPYAQGKTLRLQACQVDLMIRTRQAVYVCELKFRRHIGPGVIDEVREKVARLKLPKTQTVRTILIHSGELDPSIEASDYFDHLLNADEWVMG
ncbi:AAA family ATPase [Luteolibacter soli]|uniref:ATPase n=1 Tax=Luteolibacter soli TaxID=3135280 RepID=A0ABU9B1Z9_9BACT